MLFTFSTFFNTMKVCGFKFKAKLCSWQLQDRNPTNSNGRFIHFILNNFSVLNYNYHHHAWTNIREAVKTLALLRDPTFRKEGGEVDYHHHHPVPKLRHFFVGGGHYTHHHHLSKLGGVWIGRVW